MDAVQRLRKRAYDAGNLKTSKEQVVKVQAAQTPTQVIVIEPAQPQVVYVPAPTPRWSTARGLTRLPALPVLSPGIYGQVLRSLLCSRCGRGGVIGLHGARMGSWRRNVNANQYNNFTKNNYVNAQKYQAQQESELAAQPRAPKGRPVHDRQLPSAMGSSARGPGRARGRQHPTPWLWSGRRGQRCEASDG